MSAGRYYFQSSSQLVTILNSNKMLKFPPVSKICITGKITTKQMTLKVVSATFLLVCFACLKESTCETRKNVFYFTSKALFVLEIIKF